MSDDVTKANERLMETRRTKGLPPLAEAADYTAAAERVKARAQEHRLEWARWSEANPAAVKTCERHEHVRPVDVDLSVAKSWQDRGEMSYVHAPCPGCAAEDALRVKSEFLRRAGVEDENVTHATFDNFILVEAEGSTAKAEKNLASARAFAAKGRGFLVMLGPVGTGKSHLSVAVMREMHDSGKVKTMRFITQARLLAKLRETYRDPRAQNIVEACKTCGLLVLDEVGLSSGGRDELPMLHELLDHRHGMRKPTILTGNAASDTEFNEQVGARMADRLDQSGFKKLWFTGESMRRRFRKEYMK